MAVEDISKRCFLIVLNTQLLMLAVNSIYIMLIDFELLLTEFKLLELIWLCVYPSMFIAIYTCYSPKANFC